MIPDAFTHDDQPVYAGDYTTAQWDALKAQSLENPFAFKMGCCSSRAVLKTSINGLPFFAHYSDECATAPETKWHIAGKDMIIGALNLYGVNPCMELPGGTGKDRWKADVYFEGVTARLPSNPNGRTSTSGFRSSSGAVRALWRRVLLAGQG